MSRLLGSRISRVAAAFTCATFAAASCSDGSPGTRPTGPNRPEGSASVASATTSTVRATSAATASTTAPTKAPPDPAVAADAPIPAATLAFALPDGFEYPEGIAVDPATGRVFVTSTPSGAVAVAEPGAEVATVWLPGGTDGRTFALGIEFGLDSIWIVWGGGVDRYDTEGHLVSRHLPSGAGGFLNDVAITDEGVYVSASAANVWYLPAGSADGTVLQRIDVGAMLPQVANDGFNGIEALPDGTLVLGQFAGPLLVHLDPRETTAVVIDVGDHGFPVSDGMTLVGNDLWITRGVLSDTVDRVRLCPSYDCGTAVAGALDPALSFPTDVQAVDGAVLVVNSQFDNGGGLGDGVPIKPFWISAIATN